MPNTLVGSRSDRMQHAQSLNGRAAAVADKARNLIVLEAEDAFRRWEEAAAKLAHTRKAIAAGDRLADHTRSQFTARLKVRLEGPAGGGDRRPGAGGPGPVAAQRTPLPGDPGPGGPGAAHRRCLLCRPGRPGPAPGPGARRPGQWRSGQGPRGAVIRLLLE